MARTAKAATATSPRAAKAASRAAPAAAGAEAPDAPEAGMPEADTGAAPGKAGGSDAVRLKAFVDRVVERSGAKKKDARPLVEAVLAVLGEALHAGEELNLPPLGKIKVNRQKDTSGGEMLIVRLKRGGARPGAGKAAGAAPADAADADDDAADD